MKPVSLLLTSTLFLMPASGSIAACYDRTDGSQHRFVLNGGEAFDIKTGLTWQRCSVGMSWNGRDGCAGKIVFASLDNAKQLAKAAGEEWRVPSGPELESIIDRSCGSPVVDKAVFPDIRPDADGMAAYWTTNPVGAANLIYFFDFMSGDADGHTSGFELAVRLVKTGR
jgi:hypothetical protein